MKLIIQTVKAGCLAYFMPEARNITMEKRQISFSPPDITEAEVSAVADALRSGWITTGPSTKEIEKRIAKLCGTD